MSKYCSNQNEQILIEFSAPYYADKDIMHNMWHIDLVKKMVDKIISLGNYEVNREALLFATYFHVFVYKDEKRIRAWMLEQGCSKDFISQAVCCSREFNNFSRVYGRTAPYTLKLCIDKR